MGNATTDKVKGRLKEAAGALTGDEKLKKEGQLDQAAAEVKEAVGDVVDRAKELLGGGKKDKND
ncbi:MAG: CsbD family protein [Myxococcota bacterium]|nr:CsbD family protein [Myxococcota bacterium]